MFEVSVKLQEFKQYLIKFGVPNVDLLWKVSDKTIFLEANEMRIDLITWLFDKLDRHISTILAENNNLPTAQKIELLSSISICCGLCKKSQAYEIIDGTCANTVNHLNFWEKLFDRLDCQVSDFNEKEIAFDQIIRDFRPSYKYTEEEPYKIDQLLNCIDRTEKETIMLQSFIQRNDSISTCMDDSSLVNIENICQALDRIQEKCSQVKDLRLLKLNSFQYGCLDDHLIDKAYKPTKSVMDQIHSLRLMVEKLSEFESLEENVEFMKKYINFIDV